MRIHMTLTEFCKRFEVVPRNSLSGGDLTAREPTKYFDPFVERDESL